MNRYLIEIVKVKIKQLVKTTAMKPSANQSILKPIQFASLWSNKKFQGAEAQDTVWRSCVFGHNKPVASV